MTLGCEVFLTFFPAFVAVFFPSLGLDAFLGFCSFLLGSSISPDDCDTFLGSSDLNDFSAFLDSSDLDDAFFRLWNLASLLVTLFVKDNNLHFIHMIFLISLKCLFILLFLVFV